MFGLSRSTIAACTVAAFAVTSAIYSIGAQATSPAKSQARIAIQAEGPVRVMPVSLDAASVQDGCVTINERKIHADGSADVTSFKVCE